jgi:hypothetical protein
MPTKRRVRRGRSFLTLPMPTVGYLVGVVDRVLSSAS